VAPAKSSPAGGAGSACHDTGVNLLDWGVLALVVLTAVNGFRRGASLQLATYAGLLLGLLAGALVAPRVASLVGSPPAQAGVALVVLLVLAGVGDGLGWLVGSRIWAMAHRGPLGTLDAVAGSFVSAVAGLLAVWFLAFNLVNGPLPAVSREIRSSAIVRRMDALLPRPPSLLAEVRSFLNRFGFPEVFAGLPPAPAGPVVEPSAPRVRALAERVAPSTVKVSGEACGAIQEGSGFVGASHYVITNAHVVAGVRSPAVQRPDAGSQRAVVVSFDPKLDVAVLYVGGPLGPPLALDPEDRDRGTGGVVLGYPGGGGLTAGPGAIRRELNAVGRDIYGRSTVARGVYELQAVVRPGNSGGPFVEMDGRVAGVVFAASTTDPQVGYAITSPQVLDELREAGGRTAGVSTGACAR
jgi:S1-C subfamily serine protease